MWQEILAAIALGNKVIRTLSDFKKHADSLRSGLSSTEAPSSQFEALNRRTSDLELQIEQLRSCVSDLEDSMKDASAAAEALVQRVRTIFWIALAGCALGFIVLFVSIIAFRHIVR
jgi:hypothetical protein